MSTYEGVDRKTMIKTAFIGQKNYFDEKICEWLSEHTDLKIIIWTNNLSWAQHSALDRKRRIISRFSKRIRLKGLLRAINEYLYYFFYTVFLAKKESIKLRSLVESTLFNPSKQLSDIPQLMIDDIKSKELARILEVEKLDIAFAMCIDVYLPKKLVNLPRYGIFLWHEGITPEYRGVYSPFWALANKDYDNLGYTLFKMNSKLDAGDIYVQGKVSNIDPMIDWHSYIGHKAIIDSLSETKKFIDDLEKGLHKPMLKPGSVDGYYSYPTVTSLIKIMLNRALDKFT